MTEHNLPPQEPENDSDPFRDHSQAPSKPPQKAAPAWLRAVGGPTGNAPEAMPVSGAEEEAVDPWETVDFPGMLSADDIAPPPTPDQPIQAAELLQLIRELNQCNDALLGRVAYLEDELKRSQQLPPAAESVQPNAALLARIAELEDALERSQLALQAEVERSQLAQHSSATGAQLTVAQQKQVAQLLSELDVANDALRRTTIHNETLQAEMDAAQQRVAQLERECTLLLKRFTDKSNALQQAETTCRDLRSRLQRQQRYTLQFKAALEKSLDMSAHIRPGGTSSPSEPEPRPYPLSMPKAEQIRPWSLSSEAQAATPDTSLETLLRSLKSAGQGLTHLSPKPNALGAADVTVDPDADSQLWQDLERVVESSLNAQELQAAVNAQTTDAINSVDFSSTKPNSTSPSPTGEGSTKKDQEAKNLGVTPESISQSDLQSEDPQSNPESNQTSSNQTPGLAFTEPSPWGAPIATADTPLLTPTPESETVESESNLQQAFSQEAASPGSGLPPTLQKSSSHSPAPLVYPLKASKKLTSIAAVQLPNFPRPRRQSR